MTPVPLVRTAGGARDADSAPHSRLGLAQRHCDEPSPVARLHPLSSPAICFTRYLPMDRKVAGGVFSPVSRR